jgi:hypothetical protein
MEPSFFALKQMGLPDKISCNGVGIRSEPGVFGHTECLNFQKISHVTNLWAIRGRCFG